MVKLNGETIATNPMEQGYQEEHMLHIPAADVNDHIVQGTNVLTFEVKNWALADGTYWKNPGGLIYKFFISGNCQDNYFKSHCQLWGEKDLVNEHFWNFDDVKPGDRGTNLISLHVYDNDSWACLLVNNKQELENTWLNPEKKAGDVTENMGELSQFIKVFGWNDADQDGVYDAGEATLFQGSLANPVATLKIADSTQLPQIPGDTTKYVGLAWCFGNQIVDTVNGIITCDGSGVSDIAQSDQLIADLTAYAEQWRNNSNFTCESLNPHQLVNGGFETGDTTGWTVTGQNAVVGSYVSDQNTTYNPVEGNKFLVLTAGQQNVYTIASQQITLSAGEKLEGWAAFDAKDYLPFDDDAAVVVVSGGSITPWSASVAGTGNYGETPWTHWSFTAPSAGVYTLELKVENVGDGILPSSALFDANVVTP
ncbi:MAG: hypothetical protein NTU58_01990 [Candidatus Nealsonbacteria bacterium]|nr:hypothetical protein [Candidatus Nealsonbacteria bacterium]